MATSTEVLNGWKEIAQHLGRGVRTAQRWEKQLRLPIRRPHGDARSPVCARVAELDAWLLATPNSAKEPQTTANADVEIAALKERIEFLERQLEELSRSVRPAKRAAARYRVNTALIKRAPGGVR